MIAWFTKNGVAANLLMMLIFFLGYSAIQTAGICPVDASSSMKASMTH